MEIGFAKQAPTASVSGDTGPVVDGAVAASRLVRMRPYLIVVLIAAVSVAAWVGVVATYATVFHGGLSSSQEKWGQFGDYVGGLLNPLLGTLTLLGVIFTIILQRDLLKTSKAQVDIAHRENINGERAQRIQSVITQQHGFEATFFRMVETVNERAREIKFIAPTVNYFGIETEIFGQQAIGKFVGLFHSQHIVPLERGDKVDPNMQAEIISASQTFFEVNDPSLGPYLRTLVNLYNYVLTSRPSLEQSIKLNAALIAEATEKGTEAIRPFMHNPMFYANIVTDSRTRLELKLLALYVAGKRHDNKARIVVQELDVARSLKGKEWWGNPILPLLYPGEVAEPRGR